MFKSHVNLISTTWQVKRPFSNVTQLHEENGVGVLVRPLGDKANRAEATAERRRSDLTLDSTDARRHAAERHVVTTRDEQRDKSQNVFE